MHKIYRFLALILIISCILTANNAVSAYADGVSEIAMELTTGTVLSEKNADQKLPMASTTKIMTAIVVIENCELDSEVVVPNDAVGVEGSSIYLKRNEKISIKDLLYGLMLRSGNDSATALAIVCGGNVENFVKMMNDKAKSIGANDTNFKNPSGLPDEEHYTTARDLCKIACYAMKNPTFKEIVGTKNYSGEYRSYVNKNKILKTLDGANGVKTGYTVKAGRCLVSSAEREGMDVVCVVLDCYDMYERSSEIINCCFEQYKLKKIDTNRVFMCDIVPCKLVENCNLLIKIDNKLEYKVIKNEQVIKDEFGKIVGKLEIYSEKDLIFSANLYSIK